MNERWLPPTSTVRFSSPLISVDAAQLPTLAPVVLVPVVEPPAPPEVETLLVCALPVPPAPARPVVDGVPVVAPPALVLVTSAVVAVDVGEPVVAVDVACPVVDVVVTLLADVTVLELVEFVASSVELVVTVAEDGSLGALAGSLLQARAMSELLTHHQECPLANGQGPRQLRLALVVIIALPCRIVVTLLHQCPCCNAVIACAANEHGERKSMLCRGCQSCPGQVRSTVERSPLTACAPHDAVRERSFAVSRNTLRGFIECHYTNAGIVRGPRANHRLHDERQPHERVQLRGDGHSQPRRKRRR